MIGRRLRLIALLQLALMLLGAVFALQGASAALVPAMTLALVLPLGWFGMLGAECLLGLPLSARGRPELRTTLRARLRAWGTEARASLRSFAWDQAWREHAWPDRLVAHAGGPGVLFVHGFACNRGFWNPWLARLSAQERPFVALSLEPPWGELDAQAPALEAAAARLRAATGVAPVVVAHSMGGLVVRAWLRAGSDEARRVEQVLTLASPHQGTWMAHLPWARQAWTMRRDSAWLAALAAAEDPARRRRFTCLWSPCDNVVLPTDSACLPGAANRRIDAPPHIALTTHPAVQTWLEDAGVLSRTLRSPAT